MNAVNYKNITINGCQYYGKHMMLTLERCNDNVLSLDSMKTFLKELADRRLAFQRCN